MSAARPFHAARLTLLAVVVLMTFAFRTNAAENPLLAPPGAPAGCKDATTPGANNLIGMWTRVGTGLFGSTAFVLIADSYSGDQPAVPPPAEKLKELTHTARIPGFTADYSFTVYEDRVTVGDKTGRTVTVGVAGAGKSVGGSFRPFLEKNPDLARRLGSPVSFDSSCFGGAVRVQVFEGGELVRETASGAIWSNAHGKRPVGLRPADEIIRYPNVVFAGGQYAVATYPNRVIVIDVVAKKEMVVKVVAGEHAISDAFRTAIEKNKLGVNLGKAASGEVRLFDTAGRVQVYEGGVLIVDPETNRTWWCWHPKRAGTTPAGPVVALPKDASTVVIQLDYIGGYTPPRKSSDPYLVIRADGRVTLTDPFGKLPTIQSKLTPENVAEFVKFAVAEQNFFALDSTTLERDIKVEVKRLKLPTIVDLPTTVITIRTADKTHVVKCYAPEFYAEQLPKLKSVQQFQAVHQRLVVYMEKLRPENN